MRVAAVLEAKGSSVATIPADASVARAIAELRRLGIGALVVSPDGVQIAGIVSERDVVRHLAARGGALLEDPVATLMSTEVRTCRPDDELESLMAVMTEQRIRHVPVVDARGLAGIVSIGDVVKSRIDELQRHRDELVSYIEAR